jgi:hypothetical protein
MGAGYSGKPLAEKLGVLSEDVIRDLALAKGMVDSKVCAIDETWSGLRLTLRRASPS